VRICRIHIALVLSVLFKREVALSEREISAVRHAPQALIFNLPHLRDVGCAPRFDSGAEFAPNELGGWNDLEDS
jgi:hypothetical protein